MERRGEDGTRKERGCFRVRVRGKARKEKTLSPTAQAVGEKGVRQAASFNGASFDGRKKEIGRAEPPHRAQGGAALRFYRTLLSSRHSRLGAPGVQSPPVHRPGA